MASLFIDIAEELSGKSYFFVFFRFIAAESKLVCIICRELHETRKYHTLCLNMFAALWTALALASSIMMVDVDRGFLFYVIVGEERCMLGFRGQTVKNHTR